MSDFTSLRGHLLISMPSMQGDYFSHSVTLLIEHNRDGAFGLVISNPLDTDLSVLLGDNFEGNELAPDDMRRAQDITVLESGPVEQNRLFFLISTQLHGDNIDENVEEIAHTVRVNDKVALSTSLDILQQVDHNNGPEHILAGLGYAGWSGGQLEAEIMADVWLVTPYDHDILFNTPFKLRPEAAAKSIGVDLNLISPQPGHG